MAKDKDYISLINSMRWRRLRAAILAKEPICQRCKSDGRLTLASEVHHVIPVESTPDFEEKRRLAYDPLNLMPLCHACHVSIHRSLGKGGKEETKRRNKAETADFLAYYFGEDFNSDSELTPGGDFLKGRGAR